MFIGLKVGLRTVKMNTTNVLINGKDFYFRGFGRHEDSDIRGKGLDYPLIARDFELIKWIGANSFRTSHYPYAEEIMDMADENGIVIIDESPAVAISGFHEALLQHHLEVMKELVDRDKNRACVITWSLTNEPRSNQPGAKDYFAKVANLTRSVDPGKRPITAVISLDPSVDQAAQSVDLVGVNKYFGWYQDTGHLELIQRRMTNLLLHWRDIHPNKTIMVTEYGADTIPGMHTLPSYIFTEEFQYDSMLENFKAFDALRADGVIVGEMIWNFADFMTSQKITRVVGNKKGIFTRQRQPKASAHLLKRRYWELAEKDCYAKGGLSMANVTIEIV